MRWMRLRQACFAFLKGILIMPQEQFFLFLKRANIIFIIGKQCIFTRKVVCTDECEMPCYWPWSELFAILSVNILNCSLEWWMTSKCKVFCRVRISSIYSNWRFVRQTSAGARGVRDVALLHNPSCTDSIKPSLQFSCKFCCD
jgi:hypothetical protein